MSERELAMEKALREVMEWISNWDPNFLEDEEWPATSERVGAALAPPAEQQSAFQCSLCVDTTPHTHSAIFNREHDTSGNNQDREIIGWAPPRYFSSDALPAERVTPGEGERHKIAAVIVKFRDAKNPENTYAGREFGYSAIQIADAVLAAIRAEARPAGEQPSLPATERERAQAILMKVRGAIVLTDNVMAEFVQVRKDALEAAAQLAYDVAARCEYSADHDACDYFGCFDIQRLGDSIRALAAEKP